MTEPAPKRKRLLDGDFLERAVADVAGPLVSRALTGEFAVQPDARVGPYRIVRELGRGGMGVVCLAERVSDGRAEQVALKIVRWRGLDDSLLRRFREERQILAALRHPGIARLLDDGVADDGAPWFAMEYVPGLPIDEYCVANNLSIDDRLALFARVCDAVEHAHRNAIVHRDIKPRNILVAPDGTPRLLDFGIARMTAISPDAETRESTKPGLGLMTPDYAAPEQLRGERGSISSDVYALGVLLHQMLTGRLPHLVSGDPLIDVRRRMLAPEPPSLDTGLDPKLDDIIRKALQPRPEARYASAASLAQAVRGDAHVILSEASSVMAEDSRGVWLALITVLCWALLPITLKIASRHVDAYTLTWSRFLVSGAVLGGILGATRGLPKWADVGTLGALGLLLVAVVGLVANYVLYLVSLSYVSPTVAHVVTQLGPLLLMFGGIWLFHEQLNRRQWFGVALLIVGLLLFFNRRLAEVVDFSGRAGAGTIILLLASVTWAGYGVAQKMLLRRFTPPQTLLVIYIGATALLIAFTHPAQLVHVSGLELVMVALSCLNTLVAYGALAEALKRSGAARVGAVLAVVPLMTLAVTWVTNLVSPGFFEPDVLNTATIAGAALVTVGSALSAAR